jgi:hypothetical protein
MDFAATLRKRLTEILLADIKEVQYPSVTLMNRVESAVGTPDDLTPPSCGAAAHLYCLTETAASRPQTPQGSDEPHARPRVRAKILYRAKTAV